MRIIELKCWPEYFQAMWDGRKNFEIRKNDRNFEAGNCLILKEHQPETEEDTGRKIFVEITFVLDIKLKEDPVTGQNVSGVPFVVMATAETHRIGLL